MNERGKKKSQPGPGCKGHFFDLIKSQAKSSVKPFPEKKKKWFFSNHWDPAQKHDHDVRPG